MKNFRHRCSSLGGLLNERGTISSLLQIAEFVSQRRVCLAQADFAQRVQFRAPAALKTEFRFVKQIQLAAKGRLRASRAFGDRANAAELSREPIHDKTGFGKWPCAEDDSVGTLNVH